MSHSICAIVEHVNDASIPSLSALVAVSETIHRGSVTAAAEKLQLTHSAVSRQIMQVEAAVGRPLFRREHRRMVPAEGAVELAKAVDESIQVLRRALAAASLQSTSAALVLSCEPTLLMRWLIPRIAGLNDARILDAPLGPAGGREVPRVHLSAAGGPVDFRREGIDLAIRRNDFDMPPDVYEYPLFVEQVGPVCAPAVAASLPTVADLWQSGIPLIHTTTRSSAWKAWSESRGEISPREGGLEFEHFYLSLSAAAAGLGVAIGPEPLVRDDVAAGRLVAPFGFVPSGAAYVLLSAQPVEADPRYLALATWLAGQGAEFDR
ncbi:LysR family transcriptional regulator [Microbacterium sp. cx-59]|uniref:LysR family transcriptional regulator n=1 Tax=Microbacterium sp. cx-59 TaxID=2891207 RepID=UPI001E64CD51|nr:LysR family transcriptional regulator [Microbacterium sp. cx-59]MCC4908893.1 LysR family transcriptional regulator [Microbacterium sp. cx-59]